MALILRCLTEMGADFRRARRALLACVDKCASQSATLLAGRRAGASRAFCGCSQVLWWVPVECLDQPLPCTDYEL